MNRILKGNNGIAWWNGKLLADLTKIEMKVTGEFEDVNSCGSFETEHEYVGYTIEGTIEMGKVDSFVMGELAQAYQDGVMPDIKLVTKLKDTATNRAERVSVTGVVISEFMLASWEAKKIIQDSIPFKASRYKMLEKI